MRAILTTLLLIVTLHCTAGYRAYDVCYQYSIDRKKARKNFEYCRIDLTGQVNRIHLDPEGNNYIELVGYPLGIKSLRCLFNVPDHDSISSIRLQDKIEINGICVGIRKGRITVRDCFVIHREENKEPDFYKEMEKEDREYLERVEKWTEWFYKLE